MRKMQKATDATRKFASLPTSCGRTLSQRYPTTARALSMMAFLSFLRIMYISTFNHYRPAVLRYDRNANTYGYPAQNFGNAKGLEFDRVLVIPHGPIKKYLEKGDVEDVKKSLEKFYVAVTRAKHSVAFLYDGKCSIDCIEWNPTADS